MDLWKGKVAIVTGASSGIGAQIAKHLCKHGVRVVGLARRLDRLEELKETIQGSRRNAQFYPVRCDLTSESEIEAAFEYVNKTLGGVDIMINNAGIFAITNILDDNNMDQLRKTIDTNIMAVVSCTKKAFKSMSERDVPGYIINTASIMGYYVPNFGCNPNNNLYPSTHYALRAMNSVLRHELNYFKKNKIRISNISPGVVRTEMTDYLAAAAFEFGVMLEPEDVADAIIYMLGTNPRIQVEDLIIRPTGERD